jgi:nicotinamide-nucleotide amidase
MDAELAAADIAKCLSRRNLTVSAAESVTSGSVACRLGAAPEASEWFAGAVIAYASRVKFEVLGVTPGPVITADCARQMAQGVARLTGSDIGVAITGVGGPDPVEGHPAGTVFIAVSTPAGQTATEHYFQGDPAQVVQSATAEALAMLLTAIDP